MDAECFDCEDNYFEAMDHVARVMEAEEEAYYVWTVSDEFGGGSCSYDRDVLCLGAVGF